MSNSAWVLFRFEVNGKEYHDDGPDVLCMGSKYIVKYDSIKPDKHYTLYYEPVFLESETIKTTKGIIKKVLGKDRINGGGIAFVFEYYAHFQKYEVDNLINSIKSMVIEPIENTDSVKVRLTKYQYLAPSTNVDSLKQNMNKEYKVIYSPENYQRAILVYNNEYSVIYKGE